MEILSLKTNSLNQNNYNKNVLTTEFIGSLVVYPINYINEKCLPCDGYILKIFDYEELYSVIGNNFNQGNEAADEFRIPDYNITGEFLQPGVIANTHIAAGLPDISGQFQALSSTSNGNVSGPFSVAKNYGNHTANYTIACPILDYKFSATSCNSLYGNSDTVQPKSATIQVCIRYK